MRAVAAGLTCFFLVCILAPVGIVTVLQAQPITFTQAGATGGCNMGTFNVCAGYDDVRWVYPVSYTNRTTDIAVLVIAINVDPDYFTQIPFGLSLHGFPAFSTSAPVGIPAYGDWGVCWWSGTPVYSEVPPLSQAVADDPANPAPDVGEWVAFSIELMGDSLTGNFNPNLAPTFRFKSDEPASQILGVGVNGFASGVITGAETTFYYQIPMAMSRMEEHKMHFPQYPDTFGIDINFTDPKVLADDWQCTESGPVDIVKFWFSAKNDWFDIGDPWSQISNVHVSIHSDIPDPDGDGPLYSMPGDSLWAMDFGPYSPFVTFSEYYPSGDQAWFDPNTGEYIPSDHAHIYECVIQNIQEYFWQEEDNIYWLDLSLTTIASPMGDSLLGWKTADMDRYPVQFSGRHFQDDAVWGDFPDPFWQELTDPAVPDSGESLDLAFVISAVPDTCWDWWWGWGEWCMHDADQINGYPDGTHDCWIGVMDLIIMAREFGMVGLMLACDLDEDADVDVSDLARVASAWGMIVPNCIPSDNVHYYPPEAELHISFSSDPDNIQTYIAGATPGLYTLYVVADQMSSAVDALEFGIVTSHPANLFPPFTVTSPFNLSVGSTLQDITVASTSPVTGAAIVGSAQFFYNGDPTVSFGIAANSANGHLRATAVTDTSYRDIAATYPGYVYLDPGAGVGEMTAFENRLYATSPNPFDRSTVVRYELARNSRVTIEIFDVAGQVVETLVDLQAQEAGPYSVAWDGCDANGREVAPGVYFYRMEAGSIVKTKRMRLLK